MTSRRLLEKLRENPEWLLVLSLSAPAPKRRESAHVALDIHHKEVIARIRKPETGVTGPRILATKATLFVVVVLYELTQERALPIDDALINWARGYASRGAIVVGNPEVSVWETVLSESSNNPPDPRLLSVFGELNVSPDTLVRAKAGTLNALGVLEDEGLIIDPFFTPEMMVLFGLVPMQFSVRTAKGERVLSQLKINAPMWSLEMTRGTAKAAGSIDFQFRGIQLVRKALITLATQYLDTEEDERKQSGRPVLPRRNAPRLDD